MRRGSDGRATSYSKIVAATAGRSSSGDFGSARTTRPRQTARPATGVETNVGMSSINSTGVFGAMV